MNYIKFMCAHSTCTYLFDIGQLQWLSLVINKVE